jgi:hypothetical protein
MKSVPWRFAAAAVGALLVGAANLHAEPDAKKLASFGALEAADPAAVRAEAEAWAKKASLSDAQKKELAAIWKAAERPLFDRVIDTLVLDPQAAKLLATARDPLAPAPCAPNAVPALVKDGKQPAFFRANLALAYAKALSNRRIYEEALETLKAVKAEEVVDPAAYLFHRAVAEHAMLQKDNAKRSLNRLLDDVAEAPERYKTVAALMLLDMLTWKEKDLNWIARKMDNSGRRLELARGGPVTQKIQKDIINRLDEIIKELENKQKQSSSSNGGACPDGGGQQPSNGGGANPSSPMKDSNIANNGGPGNVDKKRFKQAVERWGSMPEKERRQFLQDLTRGMSDKHAQAIQTYFKKLVDAKAASSR